MARLCLGFALGRIARSFASVLPSAIVMLWAAAAPAQVAYNGTQTTIISGITNGGQVPYGLAVDSSGNVWVSGQGQPNSYIIEYPKSNGYVYTGTAIGTDYDYGGVGAPQSSAFSSAFDSQNNLYRPAVGANSVYMKPANSSGLANAVFNVFPFGVGVGLDGNLYVADTDDDSVVVVPLPINFGNSNTSVTVQCYVTSAAATRSLSSPIA